MDAFYIHQDIITEILIKLPVKTLIRFKSVCKAWHSLISYPPFHTLQRKVFWSPRSRRPDYSRDLLVNYSRSASIALETWYWYTMTKPPDEFKLIFGTLADLSDITTVGPCNGIYLVHDSNGKVALWNRATKDHKILSEENNSNSNEGETTYGFGSEELVQGGFDFLVVRLYTRGFDTKERVPKLYKLSTGLWRELNKPLPKEYDNLYIQKNCGACYINGVFYWLNNLGGYRNYSLVSFDTKGETFENLDVSDIFQSFDQLFWTELATYTLDGIKLLSIRLTNPMKEEFWVIRECGVSGKSWVKEVVIVDPKADGWNVNVSQHEESLISLC